MPERPVRWGILATGPMAAAFTQDLALIPDADVVAVSSRSEESARLFADRFGVPRAYRGWQGMAADPDVDVVYVATPHSQHVAATTACLDGGKAVLCEKPFALNRAQAASMTELAERKSLFLMEAMWTCLNPLVRRVRALLDEGVIGEVRSVHADFGVRAPAIPGHRLRDPAAGGGALLDLGTYPVSFAHLLLGPPDHVAAWAHLGGTGVDESTSAVLGYERGAMAVLTCSLASDSARGAVVHGTRGRIEFPADFYNPRTAVVRRDGHAPRTLVADPQTGHGYGHQAREVMRCLREKRTESPLVPLHGSLDVMGTLDRIRELVGLRYPGE
ncbi:oxidoreductase [Streptomyces agglomeratus]|uniref:Oxidoreductase n=1 Tax=Streptomyces agglomeratus TaxID=285458 RepID=A0A1E5PFW6_9ACTN|nr:Gfo/Idh/MocA family oxidoreductase [Streptomyces agglomeratus]OEJ28411.1 oxidoreductase [Streptomyces agglomeratus]